MATWSAELEAEYIRIRDKHYRDGTKYPKSFFAMHKRRGNYTRQEYAKLKAANPEQDRFQIPLLTFREGGYKPSSGKGGTFSKLGNIAEDLFDEAIETGTTVVVAGAALYGAGALVAGAAGTTGGAAAAGTTAVAGTTGPTVGGVAAAAGGGANTLLGATSATAAGATTVGSVASKVIGGAKTVYDAVGGASGVATLVGGVIDAYSGYQEGQGQAEQLALQAQINRNQAQNLMNSIPLAEQRAAEARRRAELVSGRANQIANRVSFKEGEADLLRRRSGAIGAQQDLLESRADAFADRAGILEGRSSDSLILAAETEKLGLQILEEGEEKAERRIKKGEFVAGGQAATAAGGDIDVKSLSVNALQKETRDVAAQDAKWIRQAAAREKFGYDTKVAALRDKAEDQSYQAQGLGFQSEGLQNQSTQLGFEAEALLNQAQNAIFSAEDLMWNKETLVNQSVDYTHNALAYDIESQNIQTQIDNLNLTADAAENYAETADSASKIELGLDLFDTALNVYEGSK